MPKNPKVFAVITFIIGLIIGSGGIWQYFHYKNESMSIKFAEISTLSEIKTKLTQNCYNIIDLYDQIKKTNDLPIKNNLTAKMGLLIDETQAVENKLAFIEKREPKIISTDFIPPMAPGKFRVRVDNDTSGSSR